MPENLVRDIAFEAKPVGPKLKKSVIECSK